MINFNSNKQSHDLHISVSIKMSEKVAVGLLALFLGLGSSTLSLVLTEVRTPMVIDTSYLVLPPEVPESDLSCQLPRS